MKKLNYIVVQVSVKMVKLQSERSLWINNGRMKILFLLTRNLYTEYFEI